MAVAGVRVGGGVLLGRTEFKIGSERGSRLFFVPRLGDGCPLRAGTLNAVRARFAEEREPPAEARRVSEGRAGGRPPFSEAGRADSTALRHRPI